MMETLTPESVPLLPTTAFAPVSSLLFRLARMAMSPALTFTALALREDFLPATIHYEQPDPACDLDVVPNEGREVPLRYALSNSLGFGGHNATLLLKKWEVD